MSAAKHGLELSEQMRANRALDQFFRGCLSPWPAMIARIAQTDAPLAAAPDTVSNLRPGGIFEATNEITEINETVETDVAPPESGANGSHFRACAAGRAFPAPGVSIAALAAGHGFALASRDDGAFGIDSGTCLILRSAAPRVPRGKLHGASRRMGTSTAFVAHPSRRLLRSLLRMRFVFG